MSLIWSWCRSDEMRCRLLYLSLLFIVFISSSCKRANTKKLNLDEQEEIVFVEDTVEADTIIIDSNLSFEEALDGSKAPESVIAELVLFDVLYLSTDDNIHQGQIMCNMMIAEDIKYIFDYMLTNNFVVEKVIPAVRYNWSDSLSMSDNNSYSFNYRNISYSKHAKGMAIDINPKLNPLRWKHIDKPNQPLDAVLDTTVNGTLYPEHFVVKEFRRLGFRWGHTFSKYYDDHHFEK